MRAFILAATIMAAAAFTAHTSAQVRVGVSVGDEDRNGFYFAIGSYYGVPERDVVILRDRHIRDEEMPVVFYFAEQARVRPSVIIALREDGYSWMDIALRFRLSPSLFYDPFFARPDGRGAYRSGRVWGSIRYDDDDFINFCNVRFLSRHYRCSPEEIMHMRNQHRNYYVIHNTIWREAKHNNGRWNSDGRYERHDNGRWNWDDRNNRHDNGRWDRDDRNNRHDNGRWDRDDRNNRHGNGRWDRDDRNNRHGNGGKSQDWKHGGSSPDNGPGDVKGGGSSGTHKGESVETAPGTGSDRQTPPRRRSGSGRD